MTAVVFYQTATWTRHPLSSSLWIAGLASLFFITIAVIRWSANRDDPSLPLPDMQPVGGGL
jgi:ferrous iron transport protein B